MQYLIADVSYFQYGVLYCLLFSLVLLSMVITLKKFCVLIFNRWKLPFIILVLHMTWVWKSMCNHQILSSLVLKNSEQWLSSVGPSFNCLKSWPFIQICQMVVDICTIKFAIQGVLCVIKHLTVIVLHYSRSNTCQKKL